MKLNINKFTCHCSFGNHKNSNIFVFIPCSFVSGAETWQTPPRPHQTFAEQVAPTLSPDLPLPDVSCREGIGSPLTMVLAVSVLSELSRPRPDSANQLCSPNFPSHSDHFSDFPLSSADFPVSSADSPLNSADSPAGFPFASGGNQNSGTRTPTTHFGPTPGNYLAASWEVVVLQKSPHLPKFALVLPKSSGALFPFVFDALCLDRSQCSLQSSESVSEVGQMKRAPQAACYSEWALAGNCWQSRLRSWLMCCRDLQETVVRSQQGRPKPGEEAPPQLPVEQSSVECSEDLPVFFASFLSPRLVGF